MKIKQAGMLGACGLAAMLVWGCGQKRIESSEVPQQMGASETAASVTPPPAAGHYLVERHDCLWAIAGKSRIYGDPFLWPELFKANRDQIKDPDLIYPRQNLLVDRSASVEEKNNDRRLAMETPKYVPHSEPRTTLPLDYF